MTMHVRVDAGEKCGLIYNFWDTSVFTTQDAFLDEANFERIREEHPFAKTINCVRFLGGRDGEKDDYFRGVDPDGEAICDFTYGLEMLQGIVDCGFEPRIVLDNVPYGMCRLKEKNYYGNTQPPDDPKVWNSYIRQLVEALVGQFGYERVKTWRFRVGTEPDLYPNHWAGSQVSYYKHYDNTVEAVSGVIPDADIGPGNILDPMENPSWKPRFYKWGDEIIDHCCGEFNFSTGRKGTCFRFFGTSWYGHVPYDNNRFDRSIEDLRVKMDGYPQSRDLPLEVHECSVLSDVSDENRAWVWCGDPGEWGASWMADVAERVYRLNVASIFQWATTTRGVHNPRTHVISLLQKMEGCERLGVEVSGIDSDEEAARNHRQERHGCIAGQSPSGEEIRLMLYRHQPGGNAKGTRTMHVELGGKGVTKDSCQVKEAWIIDRDHSGFIRELCSDLRKAGLKPDARCDSMYLAHDREIGMAPEIVEVFAKNKDKYQEMGRLQALSVDALKVEGNCQGLHFELEMHPHSVCCVALKRR